MKMTRVRLSRANTFFECWMPPGHIGAWLTAMAEHGALDQFIAPNDPNRLIVEVVEW